MPFVDRPLTCKDCSADFTWSARQQEHHAKLGLRNEPKRCPVCRQMQRMRNDDRRQIRGPRPSFGPPRDGGAPMRAGGPPPRGGFGGPPRGGFSAGPREVFIAKCAACGVDTDLPFKPRGDRPVYCRDCFRKQPR
jgi:CxxC-x17-CxxC domain-containing protein